MQMVNYSSKITWSNRQRDKKRMAHTFEEEAATKPTSQ